MNPKMPWTLEQFKFQNEYRWYKVYPNGTSMVASPEEIAVWEYVNSLREQLVAEINKNNIVGRKGRTPMSPKLGEETTGKPWGAQYIDKEEK